MTLDKNKDFTFHGIANEFDSHIYEQLPWYPMMKELVIYIIRSYTNRNGLIYDIGCSTGNIARGLENIITNRNVKLTGIDIEKEMLDLYPLFADKHCGDCMSYDYKPYDVALLFLICQFLDSNERAQYLSKLYELKKKTGIIIIVDKFINDKGNMYFSTIMNRFAMLLKLNQKLEAKDILNKELSLSGVQVPLHYEELPGTPVEFFRLGDFRGYILL
jgi:tRNA (cmo5U34)-methyltransferase